MYDCLSSTSFLTIKKNQRNNNFKVNYNTIWIERNMNMKLIEYKLIDD